MEKWDEKPVQDKPGIVYGMVEHRNPARKTPAYALVNGNIVTSTGDPVDLTELIEYKKALGNTIAHYTTRGMPSDYQPVSMQPNPQLRKLMREDPVQYEKVMKESLEHYNDIVNVLTAYSDHHIGNQLGYGARSDASNDANGDMAFGEAVENKPGMIVKIRKQPK